MGWRCGHAIKDLHASSLYDACREARKAFLAFASEDTKAPNPADFEPVEGEPESFIEQPADDDAQSSQSLPPPPSLRMRSKIDSLLFMPNSVKGAKPEEDVIANSDLPVAQTDAQKTTEDVAGKEIEIAVENVERPIDLYKAIFSDDDVEESNSNKVGDSEKNIEVATTTLNRLIADDFLESLGKELGLEVPPDTLYSTNKASNPAQIETPNGDAENAKSIHVEGITFSAPNAVSGTSLNPGQITSQKGEPSKYESIPGSSLRYSSKYIDGLSENISGKVKSPSRHRRNRSSSSSSEDERSRKHSRQHRYRSSDSYSDSSGDHRDCHRSGSKGRRKKSSQENSSSRKHSKHLKHRNRDSPSRSNHGSEREHSEARKEKRKWRD